tara:strand:- start:1683 stop:4529 length:2847 start_codon:yes stop_codon:yes gene_type:complete
MEANKLINDLSVAEKIELYNCLYEDLSGKGIDGDTELAHVNVEEMAVLRAMGGSGTINPHTNLIQFGGGGGSPPPPPPATQTVTQQATIPEELKPFVTDVLEKAQAIQERREEEGYVPFSGPRIAQFSPEQTQAFEQIKGLVGQGQQYFDPAARLTAASAFAPTGPQVSQFMNPYLQNVVDIQQREARRAGDIERQRLGAQAVGAGGFGGSRQAILEAEQARNLQQQLGDIQARGLAAAYEDAQARLQQQRERERLAGAQFATLGQVAPGQAFRELSALEAIGAQRQQQQQQALDIAQQEYEIARTFPERTLQDYQSIIRGYAAPIPASTIQRSQVTKPAPSFLQQAAGLGATAVGIGKAFGGFKEGGLVSLSNGGRPQIELLMNMSDIELTKAASDPNFSPTLIEKERQRRRDIKKAPDTFPAASEEAQMKRMTDFEKAKARSERRFSIPTPPVLPDRMGGDEGVSPRMTNEEIFKQALQRRDASIGSRTLPERRRQAISAMRETFPATAEEPSLPSDRQLAMQAMQDRTSKLRRTAGDVSSINNALEQRRKILEAEQRLAEKRAPSVTVALDKRPKRSAAEIEAEKRAPKSPIVPLNLQADATGQPQDVSMDMDTPDDQSGMFPMSFFPASGDTDIQAEVAARNPKGFDMIVDAFRSTDPTKGELTNQLSAAKTETGEPSDRLTSLTDERDKLTQQLSDMTAKEKEELEKQRKSIDSDKWMQLANFGFSILAQPGGQTVLEAIGKGAKDSQLVTNLSKLNDKQRALALNASQLDRRDLKDKLNMTDKQIDTYYKQRDLDLKSTSLDNEIKKLDILEAKYIAEGKSDAILNQIKARQVLLAEQQFELKLRTDLATTYKLGKDDIKAAQKQQNSFFSNEGVVFNYLTDPIKNELLQKGYTGEEAIEAMGDLPTSVFINVFNMHQRSKDKGNLGVFYNAMAKQLPSKAK